MWCDNLSQHYMKLMNIKIQNDKVSWKIAQNTSTKKSESARVHNPASGLVQHKAVLCYQEWLTFQRSPLKALTVSRTSWRERDTAWDLTGKSIAVKRCSSLQGWTTVMWKRATYKTLCTPLIAHQPGPPAWLSLLNVSEGLSNRKGYSQLRLEKHCNNCRIVRNS